MRKIILASKSPYRKQLLERLDLDFLCENSEFDENYLKGNISDPYDLTRQLSIAKAKKVQKKFPNDIIIGSDQVCHFEGQNLGKTGSWEKSFEQLMQMNGKTHELFTSYAILYKDEVIIETNITKLKIKKLTEKQIKNYLSIDNPIDCAGSYKLELKGISLMDEILTDDETAIIGLPLLSLAKNLGEFGVSIPRES
jgi:septum formation protein